ncbi:MAG: hypothetical protein E3J41_00595 [Candidatus Cloacimonadota bacterium]|nr:MAG: hypothetical protein E3J41_00595 [Candidatus Cloacimonadota bacterium]
MSYGGTWYLTVVPILSAAIMHAANTSRMNKTYAAIKGTIRTRMDLNLVRDAINLSMKLAVMYIALFVILILALFGFVFLLRISIFTGAAHLFVFGIVTLPLGLWSRMAERTIKTLQVESDNPEIEKKYREFLVKWEQPRIKLPE